MSGFADGFTKGLNSVNGLWRTYNQKENQDNMLGLREAEMGMRQKEIDDNNNFRTQQLGLDQSRLDQTARFHTDDMDYRKKQLDNQSRFQNAQLGHNNFMEQMEARKENEAELAPFAQMAWGNVARGGNFTPDQLQKMKGSIYDPANFAGNDYKQATQKVVDGINNGANWTKPEYLQSLNMVFAPELSVGVGSKDANTGKTISGKEFAKLGLSKDGKFVIPALRVRYSDGTSDIKPVTQNRSSEDGDPLIMIPTDKAAQTVLGRNLQARLVSRDPNVMGAARGFNKSNKTDGTFQGKIADIEKERAKSNASVRKNQTGNDSASNANTDAIIKQNNADYDNTEKRIGAIYGRNPPDSGDNAPVDQQRQTIMSDPSFGAFQNEGLKNNRDVTQLPTDQLSGAFTGWLKKRQNDIDSTAAMQRARSLHK